MENFDQPKQPDEIDRILSDLEDEANIKLADEDEEKARQIIAKNLAEITPEKGEQIKRKMLNKILRSMQDDDLDKLAEETLGEDEK